MPTNNNWNSQNPAQIIKGGTGSNAFDEFSVICGGITNVDPLQNVAGTGTKGQALTSNGPGMLPGWSSGSSPASNTTAFSAGISLPFVSANTFTLGQLGTIYVDPGSNVTGGAYVVPSDGVYNFAFNFIVSGSFTLLEPNCVFYLVDTRGGIPDYSMNYTINLGANAASSGYGSTSASFFYSCLAGDLIQPGITPFINYFSPVPFIISGAVSGYKIY